MNSGNRTYENVKNKLSNKTQVPTSNKTIVKTASKGYRMSKKELLIICFADMVVISENANNLQKLWHRFETGAGKFNMII